MKYFAHISMAYCKAFHDKKQEFAYMADILLFQKLSCFIISVILPLHLLSVCKHSFFRPG